MGGKILFLFYILHYTQSALIDLSCSDIAVFVSAQNAVRALVAAGKIQGLPAASEMNSMVWDEELAKEAAKWADTNPKSVNPDQTIPSGRFLISQSISVFIINDHDFKVDPEKLQIMWFNEHLNYTYEPFSKESIAPSHAPVGHFTQMIWSDSIYIGCAISENIENELKRISIVCEYGPRANVFGQLPYKSGAPSNKLICAAGEERCKYPAGKNCYAE